MDRKHYEEMVSNLNRLADAGEIQGKIIYLFGHCNATEELANLLLERGLPVRAILDNNSAKYGSAYLEIPVVPPERILEESAEDTAVCVAARAYAAMKGQLEKLGYLGNVWKLVDYNSFAEYSLSEDTFRQKYARMKRGLAVKEMLEEKYPGCYKVLCPFSALGDVFLAMSYLPYFLEQRNVKTCVVGVVGTACAQTAALFCPEGSYVESFSQKDMDELLQACLYTGQDDFFIAHQDRPYVIDLHRALYIKCIPLEQIYRVGIFGLPADTVPVKPKAERLRIFPDLQKISRGRAVIFSPYAKSVTMLSETFWTGIVQDFKRKGYQCLTNVIGEEKPLAGTMGISPAIAELQSAAEWAGTFVGLRSGLCDVLRYAKCRKTAFYPDYHYCDTKWKAIDMYALEGWENFVVKEER